MRQDTCITSLDGLRRWFEVCQKSKEGRHPYFTVWRGNEVRQDRVIHRNTEIDDSEKAWEALEEIIDLHSESGGVFRIYITYKPSHNIGFSTILKLPNTNPLAAQQPSGIGSLYGGMYGSIRELVEAETDRALAMERMKREIDDLKEAKEASVGMEQKLIEEFLPVVKQLVQTFGMKQMGFAPGAPHGGPAPAISGAEPEPFPDDGPTDDEYDYERLEHALRRLKKVVPDVESALEKLANASDKNPEMARQFLNSLDL